MWITNPQKKNERKRKSDGSAAAAAAVDAESEKNRITPKALKCIPEHDIYL